MMKYIWQKQQISTFWDKCKDYFDITFVQVQPRIKEVIYMSGCLLLFWLKRWLNINITFLYPPLPDCWYVSPPSRQTFQFPKTWEDFFITSMKFIFRLHLCVFLCDLCDSKMSRFTFGMKVTEKLRQPKMLKYWCIISDEAHLLHHVLQYIYPILELPSTGEIRNPSDDRSEWNLNSKVSLLMRIYSMLYNHRRAIKEYHYRESIN